MGFWVESFQREKAVCGGHDRAVVVKAEVAAALVVIESEFAFELAVVQLDQPPHPGQARELVGWGVGGQV